MTTLQIIEGTGTKELLRAYFADKSLLVFGVSVLEVGIDVSIKCTDDIMRYKNISADGNSFCIEADTGIKEDIKQELKMRFEQISRAWTKYCYMYTLENFLFANDISQYNYDRLNKLNNEV